MVGAEDTQRLSRCSLHRQTDGHTQLPVPGRAEQPGLLGGVSAHGRGWNQEILNFPSRTIL